jgi:TPR repeat protein
MSSSASERLQLAATQGDVQAQFKLASCFYAGDGVERDLAQAALWFRKAAELGLAERAASPG